MSPFDPFADDIDDDFVATPGPAPYQAGEAEQFLQRLRDVIDTAPTVFASNTPKVSKDELIDLLDEALTRLPEELRQARWLLKEREEFLDKVRHEGEEIINVARDRAERMVQRTEVVKAAESRAYQILDNAETEARRLRHEVEDFCDQKLASFEIVLERTQRLVTAGRAKLQGTALLEAPGPDELAGVEAFGVGEGHAGYGDYGNAAPYDEHAADDASAADVDDYEHLPPPPGG